MAARTKTTPTYTVRPLRFDADLAKTVTERRVADESLGAIAKDLGITTGKAAMAELVATTERSTIPHDDPAALAKAVADDRNAGKSWGYLAARYGITEGTARAAYKAATGKPHTTLDFRNGRAGGVHAVED